MIQTGGCKPESTPLTGGTGLATDGDYGYGTSLGLSENVEPPHVGKERVKHSSNPLG